MVSLTNLLVIVMDDSLDDDLGTHLVKVNKEVAMRLGDIANYFRHAPSDRAISEIRGIKQSRNWQMYFDGTKPFKGRVVSILASPKTLLKTALFSIKLGGLALSDLGVCTMKAIINQIDKMPVRSKI